MNRRILFLLMGIFLLTGCSPKDTIMVAEESTTVTEQSVISTTEEEQQSVYVYVCGQVNQPGVYALEVNSRICDALESAGGVTEDAKPEALDQAQYVEDGQTIYVPSLKEDTPKSGEEDGLVNINEADKNMLMTLPGIGESKADIILQYREEHGKFESIEDLMNIPGIKEGVFNKIKELIKAS